MFRPPFLANFQPLMTLEQRIVAVMAANHPLAAKRAVRLRDCAAYPVALPERSIGGRQLLEEVMARSGLSFNIAAESNSFELLRGLVQHANLISFQIGIGTMPEGNKLGLITRQIDDRDVPRANLVLGPVAGPQSADSGGGVRGAAGPRAGGACGGRRRCSHRVRDEAEGSRCRSSCRSRHWRGTCLDSQWASNTGRSP